MDDPSPPLLEALYSLKPNAIYTMAPPKAIVSAAALFSQNIVSGFRWGESGKILQILFKGSPSISARFSCENDKLISTCDCGAPARPACRHTLVAAMAVARILHEAKFHEVDLPAIRIVQFRHQLKVQPRESAHAKVSFTPQPGKQSYEIDYDSGRREASWRATGTPENMAWLKWQDTQPEEVAAAFCQWLSIKPADTEIELRLPTGTVVADQAEGQTMAGKTQLSVSNSFVTIKRTLLDGTGHSAGPFWDLGYGLVFLPETRAFAQVRPSGAWLGFSQFSCNQALGDLTLNASDFWSQIPLSPDSHCILLDENGSSTNWIEGELRPTLSATSDGSTARLSLRLRNNQYDQSIHQPLLALFHRLFEDGPFALLVQSPGRRRKLSEYLITRASSSDNSEGTWSEVSHDPAFTSASMHGNDAVRCLKFLIAQIVRMNERHLAIDASSSNPWLACTGAGTLLLRLLKTLLLVFPGEDLLKSKDLTFSFETPAFHGKLFDLTKACTSNKVDLFFDGGKVTAQKVSLSLNAIPNGSIDWFELHPELHAGTLNIPRSEWAEILQTGKYTQQGEVIAIDQTSLDSIRKISDLLNFGAESKRPTRLRLFDLLSLHKEGAVITLPEEFAEVLSSLQNFDQIASHSIPHGLQVELRAYQRHGYDWLSFLYRHRFGACLADDMGLGKTIQAITLLLALQEGLLPRQSPHPHLIILPPTLLFNWQNELNRFAPSLTTREYTGQKRIANFAGVDVILTTYDLARRDIEILSQTQFDVILFDEAQAIKNTSASRTQAMKRLNGCFRLCLTGTPLENHIGEFFSIMDAAVPEIFGEKKHFTTQYEAGLPVLERAKPFILRRTKEKILGELPPKIESDIYFSLTDRQKELYTRAVGDIRTEVLAAYQERPAQQAGIVALAALMRLRQICISPAMLFPDFEEASPKMDFLTGQLAEIIEAGHAALVFSQFVKGLDLVSQALTGAGLPYIRMDGSTPTSMRKELVENFQTGHGAGIFLISLKTGGAGLNLTRASYVYHLDPWWNPAVENQASDRTHRIGQRNSVYVQRLLMRQTIEEKMMTLKHRKQELFTSVVDRNESPTLTGEASLNPDDFKFLLSPE